MCETSDSLKTGLDFKLKSKFEIQIGNVSLTAIAMLY